MKKHISLITGLLVILLSTIVTSFTNAQIAPNQTVTEAQKANDTIVANQILTLWQNDSAYIGIGTVQDVTCKLETLDEGETIFTYAEISVDVPLTDNLDPEQTILIKYLGGQVDNLCLTVNIEWQCFPNDTVTPPSIFELSKGQSILFFVEETTSSLRGYIPYTIADVTEQEPPRLLASDPQPTTEVLESAGYGFATYQNGTDCIHIDWGKFPWEFHVDPTGTSDISGDDELAAIPPVSIHGKTLHTIH